MSIADCLNWVRGLRSSGVPLAIIGGHAVIAHGHVRSTEDVDLIFLRTRRTEELLFQALNEINAYWVGDQIDPATGLEQTVPVSLPYIRANHLMLLGTDHGFIDLFDFVPGLDDVTVEQLIDQVVVRDELPFVSLPILRRLKQASDRPLDRSDLENLPEC